MQIEEKIKLKVCVWKNLNSERNRQQNNNKIIFYFDRVEVKKTKNNLNVVS